MAAAIGLLVMGALLTGIVGNRWGSTQWQGPLLDEGWSAYQAGDADRLSRVVTALQKQTDSSAAANLLEGALLIVTGQPASALDSLNQVPLTSEAGLRARQLAALAYYQLNHLRDAQLVLVDLVQADPDNLDARRLLGALYYDLGANPQAIEQLQRVVSERPNDVQAWRLIGLMKQDFQQFTDAAAAYREALRGADGKTVTAASLPASSVRPFGPTISEPERIDLRLQLARCELELKQFSAALATAQPLPVGEARDAILLIANAALGQSDTAAEIAASYQELSRVNSPEICRALADYWDDRDDTLRAESWYRRSLELSPCDFVVRYRLARILKRMHRDQEAETESARSREDQMLTERLHELQEESFNRPTDSALRIEMGEIALLMMQADLAKAWFEAALGLDPNNPAARQALQELDPRPDLNQLIERRKRLFRTRMDPFGRGASEPPPMKTQP